MALLLHDLVLEGLANVEPHIRVVQNSVEVVRAVLRWRGGLLRLEHLSAIGFDVSQAGSLEIFMNGGISGDSLLGSVPLHSMLSGASHGRLESHIGPDIRISFDHEFLVRVFLPQAQDACQATPKGRRHLRPSNACVRACRTPKQVQPTSTPRSCK
jgi:hypothetical protein